MLSKILLLTLVGLLLGKLGLRQKLKQLMPRLDRAVNVAIVGLVIIYVGHLLWWLTRSPSP